MLTQMQSYSATKRCPFQSVESLCRLRDQVVEIGACERCVVEVHDVEILGEQL